MKSSSLVAHQAKLAGALSHSYSMCVLAGYLGWLARLARLIAAHLAMRFSLKSENGSGINISLAGVARNLGLFSEKLAGSIGGSVRRKLWQRTGGSQLAAHGETGLLAQYKRSYEKAHQSLSWPAGCRQSSFGQRLYMQPGHH
jgi:hypothetical protein